MHFFNQILDGARLLQPSDVVEWQGRKWLGIPRLFCCTAHSTLSKAEIWKCFVILFLSTASCPVMNTNQIILLIIISKVTKQLGWIKHQFSVHCLTWRCQDPYNKNPFSYLGFGPLMHCTNITNKFRPRILALKLFLIFFSNSKSIY